MPENEKPKLSAELLHQLLGEHVEKAGQTLRRREQLQSRRLLYYVVTLTMTLTVPVFFYISASASNWVDYQSIYIIMWLIPVAGLAVGLYLYLEIVTVQAKIVMQDLALAAWQLRRIYELASRYEDTGPEIEPALRTGIVLKLGEAQLLLAQLEKFEAKDGRFEYMRSLGPDPLKVQSREEVRPSATTDLATTER